MKAVTGWVGRFIIGLCTVFALSTMALGATNPLETSHFQPAEDGLPPGWQPATGEVGKELTFVEGEGRSGGWAFVIVDESPSVGPALKTDYLPITSGVKYRASVWVKTPVSKGRIYLQFFNIDKKRVVSELADPARTGAWEQIAVEWVAPADAVWAVVRLDTPKADMGVVYFDDVELVVVP